MLFVILWFAYIYVILIVVELITLRDQAASNLNFKSSNEGHICNGNLANNISM